MSDAELIAWLGGSRKVRGRGDIGPRADYEHGPYMPAPEGGPAGAGAGADGARQLGPERPGWLAEERGQRAVPDTALLRGLLGVRRPLNGGDGGGAPSSSISGSSSSSSGGGSSSDARSSSDSARLARRHKRSRSRSRDRSRKRSRDKKSKSSHKRQKSSGKDKRRKEKKHKRRRHGK
jgi:hypothetical protein